MYAKLEKMHRYYDDDKWEYRRALQDLRGKKKILEIGCGSGKFMALAKREEKLSIEGLERNQRAIHEAAERGIVVRDDSAELVARNNPGSYDVVCSFQVVEHVPRLGSFLKT